MKKIKFYPLIQAGAVDTIDVIVESDATILDVLAARGITDTQATVYFGWLAYDLKVPTRDLNAIVPEWHVMYWAAGDPPPETETEQIRRELLDEMGYWDLEPFSCT